MTSKPPEKPSPPVTNAAIPTPILARRRASGDAPAVIKTPGREDRIRWWLVGSVGGVALLCGWFWPRACGLKPDVEEDLTAAAGSATEVASNEPPPVVTSGEAATTSEPPAPAVPSYAIVTVGKSTLMHCQDPPKGNLKPSKCGEPQLEALLQPRLEDLAHCEATTNVTGRLQITVDLDFAGKTAKVTPGKSSIKRAGKLDDKAIEPLLACLRPSLTEATDAQPPAATHARYTIAVALTLAPLEGATPGETIPATSGSVEKPITGTATVTVGMAQIRDRPGGNHLDNLAHGTKVTLTGYTVVAGEGWYHVEYDDGAKTGWIYHLNIGK